MKSTFRIFGLIGTALLACSGAEAAAPQFKVLYSGPPGQQLLGTLADSIGRDFFTTYGGGKHNGGTVLRVDGDGDAKDIYDFSSHKGPAQLTARLLRDSSGDIFGI